MSRAIACLLALVLSLTGLGAVAGSASAAPGDGYITGTVTGTGGQPLVDIWVNASVWDPDEEEWDRLSAVRTNPSGQYQLGPLVAGTYNIYFESDGDYAISYLDDFVVAPGQTVTGKNVQMVVGGSISGTVTNPSGNNVNPTFVQLWWWDTTLKTWSPSMLALTSQGEYTFRNVAPGPYRVEFQPTDFMPEFWSNAATVQTARSINVSSGRTVTGIDAQLDYGASLSGTITGTGSVQLSGIRAVAYRFNSATKVWEQRATATSGGGGGYLLRGLAAGTYRLEFWDPTDAYTTEYWPGAASLETATSFTVGTNDVFDRDVELSTDPFPAVTNLTKPTITGTAQVGKQLTASTGTWTPATGLTFGYQWFIGTRRVDGATSSTFTPPVGVGKTVRVDVYAAKAGHTTDFESSAATAPLLQGAVGSTAPPSISGVPRVGATVTASPGTWDPVDTTVGYQWLLDGQPVAGATSSSYAATPSDFGRSLSVRVSASSPPWAPSAATSAAATVGAGTLAATVKPKVTGKAKKKAVLKVSAGAWSPAAVKVKLQWYAGAKAIRKATTAKLKLAGKTLKAVRKKAISVRVTVSAPGYTTVVTRLKVPGKVR
jgi:hypothetical protein